MTEHELQNSIIQYLELKKFYVMRLNSGVIPSFYKGKQRMIRLSKKGTPDLMAFSKKQNAMSIWNLKLIFIELKVPGKNAEPEQIEMMKELERFGAKCVVIHSITELQELLGI